MLPGQNDAVSKNGNSRVWETSGRSRWQLKSSHDPSYSGRSPRARRLERQLVPRNKNSMKTKKDRNEQEEGATAKSEISNQPTTQATRVEVLEFTDRVATCDRNC